MSHIHISVLRHVFDLSIERAILRPQTAAVFQWEFFNDWLDTKSVEASVRVDGEVIGSAGRGLLVLLGVQKEDDKEKADRLLDKILRYRVFPDYEGRMNRSISDIDGDLLVVSQFTLAADTRKGTRPGFSGAAGRTTPAPCMSTSAAVPVRR